MKKYTAKEIEDEWYGTLEDLRKESSKPSKADKGNAKLQKLTKVRNVQIKKKIVEKQLKV